MTGSGTTLSLRTGSVAMSLPCGGPVSLGACSRRRRVGPLCLRCHRSAGALCSRFRRHGVRVLWNPCATTTTTTRVVCLRRCHCRHAIYAHHHCAGHYVGVTAIGQRFWARMVIVAWLPCVLV